MAKISCRYGPKGYKLSKSCRQPIERYEENTVRQESFTKLPREIVDYAERKHPQIPIGEFFERALRRVANSSVAERKNLVAIGKPFTADLAGWVRCPYSIESGVWDRFTETIEKRKDNPAAILAGAMMAELGMS
jgi:hypothetical protein